MYLTVPVYYNVFCVVQIKVLLQTWNNCIVEVILVDNLSVVIFKLGQWWYWEDEPLGHGADTK